MDRRDFLVRLAGSALLPGLAPEAAHGLVRRRRLLCFTKSSGFQHGPVRRGADGSLSLVERTLVALGEREGFDVTCTKDGSVFTPAGLRDFDAFFFYTSGYLTEPGTDGTPPMPAEGKAALLDAIRGGKGFVGIHSASDSFHTLPDPPDRSNRYVNHGPATDPYLRMLGGEFIAHGKQQSARMRVTDPSFPGMDAFGALEVNRFGEWYSLKDFAPDLRVLAVLDTQGMPDAVYQRPPFPVIWAHPVGHGRAFYSALGHLEAEWSDPAFMGSLRGALRWAFGDAEADLTPNLVEVAPRHAELPPRPAAT